MNPTAQRRRTSSHNTQKTSWSSWVPTWPLSASTKTCLCLRRLIAYLMWCDSLRTTLIWPPTRGYRKDCQTTLFWWESTSRGMLKSPGTSSIWNSSRSWFPCWYPWGKRCWFLTFLKCSHLCQVCIACYVWLICGWVDIGEVLLLFFLLKDDKLKTEREVPPHLLGPDFACKHFPQKQNQYFHLHGGIEFDVGTPRLDDITEEMKVSLKHFFKINFHF